MHMNLNSKQYCPSSFHIGNLFQLGFVVLVNLQTGKIVAETDVNEHVSSIDLVQDDGQSVTYALVSFSKCFSSSYVSVDLYVAACCIIYDVHCSGKTTHLCIDLTL